MGDIDERQGRIVLRHHVTCGISNPATRLDGGCGTPEFEQREGAKPIRQLRPKARWRRVTIWQFAPVSLVDRSRSDAHVMARRHVKPPEEIGAGEGRIPTAAGVPDLLTSNEPVGLTPEED